MTTFVPSAFLRSVLLLDAIGTASVAMLQLVGGEPLAVRTGLPEALLYGTGVFMLVYAAALVVLATRRRVAPPFVAAVVGGNAAWGLAAIGVGLGVGTGAAPTEAGVALVVVHVVAVLLFSALQYVGLRQSLHGYGGGLAQSA